MSKAYNGLFNGVLPKTFDFQDKEKSVSLYIGYMLSRTQSMFRYSGLPDSIPQRIIELYLQTNGNVCFAEYKNTLYAFTGGLGGEPDEYYMPTIYTVANPYLRFSDNLKINKNCVVVSSDSLYMGLTPLFSRYASLMVENDISMRLVDINARIVSLISAPDDRTKVSADQYIKDVETGKLGIIAENAFLDGVKVQPYSTSGSTGLMTNLIEYQQYLKAGWFNDLGLQANYNMKRESINSNEAQLNDDALLPLIDDMLNCRKIGLEKVNKMFGVNISVDLNSSWKDRQETEPVSGQPEKEEPEQGETEPEKGGGENV